MSPVDLPISRDNPVNLWLGLLILFIVYRTREAEAVTYILPQRILIWLHPQLDTKGKLCNKDIANIILSFCSTLNFLEITSQRSKEEKYQRKYLETWHLWLLPVLLQEKILRNWQVGNKKRFSIGLMNKVSHSNKFCHAFNGPVEWADDIW